MCSKVIAIDVLSGFEQELACKHKDGGVVVPNLFVRDYPLLIKLVRAAR